MYQDLYFQMMKQKNPKESAHRITKQPSRIFDAYKDGWNQL